MLNVPLKLVIFISTATLSAATTLADFNNYTKGQLDDADFEMDLAEKRIHETEVLQALDPEFK